MINILITGAAGQLGLCLQSLLVNKPFNILALSRHQLDIASAEKVNQLVKQFNPQVIINLAAYTDVARAEIESDQAYKTNVTGVANLAVAANAVSALLIHFSSDYVFSGSSLKSYSEIDLPDPINNYGITKLEGEKQLAALCEKYICLRSSWLFSEFGNNFVIKLLWQAKEKNILKVVSDEYGAPTYAKSLALCVLKILDAFQKRDSLAWGIYHFSGVPSVSRYEFAVDIIREAKKYHLVDQSLVLEKISREELDKTSNLKRPIKVILDSQRISDVFNIEQPMWIDGLQETMKSLTASPNFLIV